jgi:periplasmic protein CpxP/Spy
MIPRNRRQPAGFLQVLEDNTMRMKIYTLALSGLLTLGMAGGAAMAQDMSAPPQQGGPGGGRHGMDPEAQLKHLTKALDLTSDQQAQLKPMLDAQHQQMEALHQDQSMSREDRFAKMKTIREDSKTKIEAVLNDSQKQKFEAMQERMHDRRGGGQEPPPQG